ncbi:MAG TPA: M3 family oligoendopeptidase [Tepidisphaeraceae bacterium]|nr:M3 family oligoendopeptidase [Tepidisphaeraceae bacterium]
MAMTMPARIFVPADLDPADFARLEPLYQSLLDRPVSSAGELEAFLRDFSELSAVVDEYANRRYIDKSCHTEDKAIEAAFLHFVEQISPRVKPLYFRLQKKFLESPALGQLTDIRYRMLTRQWRVDVELFREENVAIDTEVEKAANEYGKICGAMMVDFRGRQYTPAQMARFSEETDRTTRQEAWEANVHRRLEDREKVDAIFEQLLPMRQQIAANAGLANFREYAWKANKRFDYTPADCLRFADAIAETCVPLVAKLNAQRARELGVQTLRPWDLEVDVKGRAPLHPFAEDQVPTFVAKTREIFNRLSPALARDFDQLGAHGNLDLDSRKGKEPGGYQCSLEESKQPFIFMNAAGLQRDVETLLHEGGHAFHYQAAAAREPLIFLRNAPMEFCEVASMSMELLGSEYFTVFYDEAQAARAKRKLFEGIIRFLPWMAIIDSFQHWMYTHAGHTRAQRTAQWLELLNRFTAGVDWNGYEAIRESSWQPQRHLFHSPFYYIEYGIAQLGALQLWMRAKSDPRQALSNYRAALALGGTRTLPELFETAGIAFDFSQRTLGPLMEALREELEGLR